MATNFPTSLDSLTNPTSSSALNLPSHSSQHADANDAIEALQAKVGVDGSAVTTSLDYKVANAGGLALLSDTTISSGSSSVTVSSVFSSSYANYKILIHNIRGSASADIRFKFAAGGNGYYWASRSKSIAGSTDDDNGNYFGTGTDWWIGYVSSSTNIGQGVELNLFQPNIADKTGFSGIGTGQGYQYICGGYNNKTTQFTGFTINPASGTFSQGEIRVYGVKGT